MKNFLLSICAIIFINNSYAQITITQADMPIINDSSLRANANNFNSLDFTLTGTNYNWDFSTLLDSNRNSVYFKSINAAPALGYVTYGLFATANLKSQLFLKGNSPVNFGVVPLIGNTINVDSTFEYYKSNANVYARTGFTIHLNGIDLPLPYDSNDVLYKLPMNYGNVDSGVSIFTINTSLIPIYYSTKQKRINTVDGWGTLKLPNSAAMPVLRLKSEIYAHDTAFVDTILHQGFGLDRPKTVEYKWFTNAMQTPVLEVSGTETTGVYLPQTVKYYNKTPLAIAENLAKENLIRGYYTIENNMYEIKSATTLKPLLLLDINGNVINFSTSKIDNYTTRCNFNNIPNGVYILKAMNENGNFITEKIIKK